MSVQDHRYHRPAPGADFQERLQGRLSPFWRWLTELVWRLEHGFERARADARPEEDTRVRIFLIPAAAPAPAAVADDAPVPTPSPEPAQ